ncbi:efflux RND transporter permease subunit, partial [Rhizobium ruizarguesonis]
NSDRTYSPAVDAAKPTGMKPAVVISVPVSIGWRSGLVIAIAIPLVLDATFELMYELGIDLQRISLGALIIALGLLVDDAMI